MSVVGMSVILCSGDGQQVKLLQKGVAHIGVGTPGRIGALVQRGLQDVAVSPSHLHVFFGGFSL